MFERMTDRARRVIVIAKEESERLGHDYIGDEHILLALIHEGEGIAAISLLELGVNLDQAREYVLELSPRGDTLAGITRPFSVRAKRVLELDLREALALDHNYIGTEHLLLALVNDRMMHDGESEPVSSAVLSKFKVTPRDIRREVLGKLGLLPPRRQFIQLIGQAQSVWASVDSVDGGDKKSIDVLKALGVDPSQLADLYVTIVDPEGVTRSATLKFGS